ncbi:MAG: NTP transferase domain-containing protein, partial [Chloroflexi bacterium]|nr:NTP transferase domain-containing protein [Chloroflexota bacterium]
MLKVVILAAAQGERPGVEYPRVLQRLGDKPIINHVMELALQVAAPDDIYVIVGYMAKAVQEHLGPAYHYVLQEQALGTGHAVAQMAPPLRDYAGDLLILYGDTPLFRLSSLRGMLLRHTLKQADLTLFAGVSHADTTLPYGRIVRSAAGEITEVVEEADASADVRRIRELNLGAYVARARPLFGALEQIAAQSSTPGVRLTDVVRLLAGQGAPITSYQSCDQDEFLGINTPENLIAAEIILQKRLLRPRRIEEENIISFGTGGWRAVIGEGFTLYNVRRLSQALANRLVRNNQEAQGALIGYDRRFLSEAAADAAAEVFAGNNIRTALLDEAAPTPLITYATVEHGAAYGLAFTASHNPPEWNGLKVFKADGSLLLEDET